MPWPGITVAGATARTRRWCVSAPGKMSDELLQASVQVIDRARCNAEDAYQGEVTAEMLCAGVLQGGVDTCQVSLAERRESHGWELGPRETQKPGA